jgi:hypothetical protein
MTATLVDATIDDSIDTCYACVTGGTSRCTAVGGDVMPRNQENTSDEPVDDFGPVRPHLVHKSEDHEQGWRKEVEAQGGGEVPALRSERTLSRVPLAQQFADRVKQAESGSSEKR